MGTYIFTSALRDFLRPVRILSWALVAAVLGFLAWQLSGTMSLKDPAGQFGQIAGAFVFKVCALAAAIFASNVISQEVEQKTIVYVLTRPIPRWSILSGRLAAATLSTFLVSIMALVGVAVGIPGIALGSRLVQNDVVALAAASAAYCCLFTFISLLINKSMLVNLIFAFGWETLVPNTPGSSYYLSISTYALRIADHPITESMKSFMRFFAGQSQSAKVSLLVAWLVMGLTIALFAALAAYWFTRFEYVPRDDTE